MKTGYKPSMVEASHAYCCECTGNYGDGRKDCRHQHCELYSKHKFRQLTPNYNWVFQPWANHEIHRRALGMTQEEYIIFKFGKSKKIGLSMIFKAICFKCNAYFQGGMKRQDCEIVTCPIYYWMPYRQHYPNLDWMFDLNHSNIHNQRAVVEGYIIRGKTQTLIDRQRYIEDHLTWTGPHPKIITKPSKKVHRIA